MINFTYSQLISVGAHLGMSYKNFWFLSSWMLLGITQNICILNLKYSLSFFKLSLSFLKAVVFFKQSIWFVNLDKTKELCIRSGALLCGEFYFNAKWIYGLLSNYLHIFIMFRNFFNLPLYLRPRQLNLKLSELTTNWFLTRFTWPRLLFVSNSSMNMHIIKEALDMGIACLVITDTIYMTDNILFPIPGNDKSIIASDFYNQFIGQFVLRLKFVNIFFWFHSIRHSKRLLNFKDWLSFKLNQSFCIGKKILFNYTVNWSNLIYKGINFSMFNLNSQKILKNFLRIDLNFIKTYSKLNFFKIFLQMHFLLQRLNNIWIVKFWLKERSFGLKKKLYTRGFICKPSKQFGSFYFFKFKVNFINYVNSNCFIFLVQSFFLNLYLNYVNSNCYNKFKKKFNTLNFSIFLLMSGILFRQIGGNCIQLPPICLNNIPDINKLKLVHTTVLTLLQIKKTINNKFWNIEYNVLFYLRPVPLILTWFIFNINLKNKYFFLLKSQIFINMNKWKYIYKNLWWSKKLSNRLVRK